MKSLRMKRIQTPLQKEVCKQLGYDLDNMTEESTEELKDSLHEVTEYGAETGHSGFIYYYDTIRFFQNNKSEIKKSLRAYAESLDTSVLSVVKGCKCLKGVVTEDDIGEILYGEMDIEKDEHLLIANTLAWYTLETVAYELLN